MFCISAVHNMSFYIRWTWNIHNTFSFKQNVKKYGQELDAEQLALIDLPNFEGYSGDTLMDDKLPPPDFPLSLPSVKYSGKLQYNRHAIIFQVVYNM